MGENAQPFIEQGRLHNATTELSNDEDRNGEGASTSLCSQCARNPTRSQRVPVAISVTAGKEEDLRLTSSNSSKRQWAMTLTKLTPSLPLDRDTSSEQHKAGPLYKGLFGVQPQQLALGQLPYQLLVVLLSLLPAGGMAPQLVTCCNITSNSTVNMCKACGGFAGCCLNQQF